MAVLKLALHPCYLLATILVLAVSILLREHAVLVETMPDYPLRPLGRVENILAVAENLIDLLEMETIRFREEQVYG